MKERGLLLCAEEQWKTGQKINREGSRLKSDSVKRRRGDLGWCKYLYVGMDLAYGSFFSCSISVKPFSTTKASLASFLYHLISHYQYWTFLATPVIRWANCVQALAAWKDLSDCYRRSSQEQIGDQHYFMEQLLNSFLLCDAGKLK